MSSTRRHHNQPTQVVHAHLAQLLQQGVSRPTITAQTGVSARTLHAVLNLEHPNVRGSVAAALYTVRPDTTSTHNGLVPALGTIRRLQALIAHGYTLTSIATRAKLALSGLRRILNTSPPTVVSDTHHRIARVYDQLSATPGPCDKSRRLGRVNHWPAPGAWDNIDDPAEDATHHVRDPHGQTHIDRVLRGEATVDLLTPRHQNRLWQQWSKQQQELGLPASARRFAAQFRISWRRAADIRATAENTPTAASRRTNKRKAA